MVCDGAGIIQRKILMLYYNGDTIRILTVKSKEDSTMSNGKERRKYKRTGLPYYMTAFQIKHHEGLKTSSAGWDWVVLKDLSAGGALFSYNKNLEIGTLLDLIVDVSKHTPAINCVGGVTRIEQSQPHSALHFAIEFEDIDKQAKELINKVAEEIIEQKANLL